MYGRAFLTHLHHFMNHFLQLVAEKNDSINGAARKCFDPSCFLTALGIICGFLPIESQRI
jgi:hypothetical protein